MEQNKNSQNLFVSYASEDRERILPIVEQLEMMGLNLWIDKHQIPGGADYTQEIPKAIGNSKGVMVFLSSFSLESKNVKKELNIAWKKNKPVLPLHLENIEITDEFMYNLEGVQYIELFNESENKWVNRVQQALQTWGIELSNDLGKSEKKKPRTAAISNKIMANSPLVPFLVNRSQQDRELREQLKEHCEAKTRGPLIFLVYGRTEQAINEYIERVEKVSLPRLLKRLDFSDIIKWVNLPWIRNPDWHQYPDRTLQYLSGDIEDKLELKPGAWPEEIASNIIKWQSNLGFCYRLRWEQWTKGHLDTLYKWELEWKRITNLPLNYLLVVFIVVEYEPKKAGFFDRVLGERPNKYPVKEQLEQLVFGDNNLSIKLLSELGNVSLQDIEDWIVDVVRPSDPANMIRQAREILDNPELFAEDGAPMNRLSKHLALLIEKAEKLYV